MRKLEKNEWLRITIARHLEYFFLRFENQYCQYWSYYWWWKKCEWIDHQYGPGNLSPW